jgi:excisionase family DNA binding protein
MATLTLGQAAKLAGVGKTTLTRAIKSGRLSAERREDGGYRIDPAELARVYEITLETPETVTATGGVVHRATPESNGRDTVETVARLAALDAQIQALQDLVRRLDDQARDLREDRDQWRVQAERLALSAPAPARRGWWLFSRKSG